MEKHGLDQHFKEEKMLKVDCLRIKMAISREVIEYFREDNLIGMMLSFHLGKK